MENLIESMFPVLNAHLHLSPDSPYISNLLSERDRRGLNMVAAEMLSYCDGSITVEDIINKIIDNYKLEKKQDLYNGLVDFFVESKNLGYIVLNTKNHKIRPIISGSLRYYSPETIQIEITQQCPLRCKHCYVFAAPDKLVRMPLDLANKILDQSKELGVSNIVLTGGDPMMHPNFWEILDKASRFYRVNLLTSGYLINEKAAEKISKYRNVNVQISVDGIGITHNRFRGKDDAFERTINALKYLQKHNVKVAWAMTITENNFLDFEDCIKLAKKIGVGLFRPGIVFNSGRAENQFQDDIDFMRRVKQKISEFQEKYNDNNFRIDSVEGSTVQSNDSMEKANYEQINCGAGWNFCHVTAKGEVLACPIFPYELIDLNKDDLLSYFSKKDEMIHLLHSPKKGICKNCKFLERDNGCLAQGLLSSKSNQNCSWINLLTPEIKKRLKESVYTSN